MNLKKFMDLYDDWNGNTVINDNELKILYKGSISKLILCGGKAKEENWLNKEVVSFGFYDNELCVRIK